MPGGFAGTSGLKPDGRLWEHFFQRISQKWPFIRDHHNQQAALQRHHIRLVTIENPDLIYIGQTIMIPTGQRPSTPGTGQRHEANQAAKGVDLKMEYKIEGPETQYRVETPGYTIDAKLSGTITMANMMHDRYEHNFELSLGRNDAELKHKLGQYTDHVFRDLTQGVSMDYADGKVTIQAPIMYKAGLGPYTIELAAESPTVWKGTLRPEPFSTIANVGRRRYKHTTNIQFDVTVMLRPVGRLKNPEVARETSPLKEPGYISETRRSSNTASEMPDSILVSVLLIILGTIAWQMRMPPAMQSTTTIGPFMHTVPMNQHGSV